MYELPEWPGVPAGRRSDRDLAPLVARLRLVQRLTVGFLDPLEDALYLTVALRLLGCHATFHLGRELAPLAPPAGVYAWVECGTRVVSTSLPVLEDYVRVHAAPCEVPG